MFAVKDFQSARRLQMTHPPDKDTDDAAQWWRAYQLAENDQADELRERSAAGDDYARRQLASWLSDRARTKEAIEVIRPLADAGDDVAELWLARWLADCDRAGELRQRTGAGSYHALLALAGWLADHQCLKELRDLFVDHQELLSEWLAAQTDMRVVRLAADLGDDDARRRLDLSLARLRQRADSGNEHARDFLAKWLD
jgi:hypothetical protein